MPNTKGTRLALAAVLLASYASFCVWQRPGLLGSSLNPTDVDGYMAALERNLEVPEDVKTQLVGDLRAWGNADDGQPVYMLNLMRYHDALKRWPGAPELAGAATPEEANSLYERMLVPLALRSGDYPIFIGTAQGRNLIDPRPGVDAWSRVAVMRYPSRRAFLAMVSDPTFGRLFAYKYAADEVALIPTSAAIVVPDLRLLVGGLLLILYLVACVLPASTATLSE